MATVAEDPDCIAAVDAIAGTDGIAALLNIRDHVKSAVPEPKVLKTIGDEAKQNGTAALTSRQIDRVIRAVRTEKRKRKGFVTP